MRLNGSSLVVSLILGAALTYGIMSHWVIPEERSESFRAGVVFTERAWLMAQKAAGKPISDSEVTPLVVRYMPTWLDSLGR